jgi:hypothetical protein
MELVSGAVQGKLRVSQLDLWRQNMVHLGWQEFCGWED